MNKKYTKTFFMLCHKFLKVELNNKTAQNKNWIFKKWHTFGNFLM